jgi:hypothetical protein
MKEMEVEARNRFCQRPNSLFADVLDYDDALLAVAELTLKQAGEVFEIKMPNRALPRSVVILTVLRAIAIFGSV